MNISTQFLNDWQGTSNHNLYFGTSSVLLKMTFVIKVTMSSMNQSKEYKWIKKLSQTTPGEHFIKLFLNDFDQQML